MKNMFVYASSREFAFYDVPAEIVADFDEHWVKNTGFAALDYKGSSYAFRTGEIEAIVIRDVEAF